MYCAVLLRCDRTQYWYSLRYRQGNPGTVFGKTAYIITRSSFRLSVVSVSISETEHFRFHLRRGEGSLPQSCVFLVGFVFRFSDWVRYSNSAFAGLLPGLRNRSGEEYALFGLNPRLQMLRSPRLMNRFQCNWVQNEATVVVVPFPATPGSHLTATGTKNSTEVKTKSKNSARQHFF